MRKFARTLASMACRTEAALNFVDELKKSPCSEWEMTGFRQFAAACEVAVPTRRKKTRGARTRAASRHPAVWWRAGEPRRTLLQFPSQEPSRRSSGDSLGRPELPFGQINCRASILHAASKKESTERGAPNLHHGPLKSRVCKPAKQPERLEPGRPRTSAQHPLREQLACPSAAVQQITYRTIGNDRCAVGCSPRPR